MVVQDAANIVTDGDQLNDGYFNGISGVITVEAGESVTANKVGYIHLTNGEAYTSDIGTADDIRANGIFLTSGSDGDSVNMITSGVHTTSGLIAKESYYLGANGAISTTPSGVRIGTALSTTRLYVKIIQDDRDMVSTTKAIQPDITGVPANNITAFWQLMDGTTISDAESPLNGQTVRDSNANQEILRGNDTSGGTSGDETHTHNIGGNEESDGTQNSIFNLTTNAASSLQPALDVVWIIKKK